MDTVFGQFRFDFVSVLLGGAECFGPSAKLIVREKLLNLFAPTMKTDFPASAGNFAVLIFEIDASDVPIGFDFFGFHDLRRLDLESGTSVTTNT